MKKIPEFLDCLLEEEYGRKLTDEIIKGYSRKRRVTMRVNTLKSNSADIKKILKDLDIRYHEVPWYQDALILEEVCEHDIMELDIYKNGEIYLQSLSSMLPALILGPQKDESILDMTAAPGGKTTQIVALSKNEALITACEKNKIRAERLKYNLLKQGASRVGVIIDDARKLDDFLSFDKILLDAPCSGSGTLYLEGDIEKVFSEELVKRSVKIQQELLNKAIRLLKPNHEMIYSTCSVLKEENEKVLKKYLDQKLIKIVPMNFPFESLPLLPTTIPNTICICPTELYEGFFVAKIQKI